MRCLLFVACIISLCSCFKKKYPYPDFGYEQGVKVYGWKPTYGADTAYKKLTYHNSGRPVSRAGKIYAIGNTIYQNDILKGIHIIDNSDPANASRTAFLELAGNTEMAIKGNYLYANNYNDIVVIDITHPETPVEIKRLKNMFSSYSTERPYEWQQPQDTGFYVCNQYNPDSVVIGWVKDSIYSSCYKK